MGRHLLRSPLVRLPLAGYEETGHTHPLDLRSQTALDALNGFDNCAGNEADFRKLRVLIKGEEGLSDC